jgi:NTE family protein
MITSHSPPNAQIHAANQPAERSKTDDFGQIVLVLQGGGALGAYQVGVYQAMHEAGIEPDWVIGTSIGAINAALIAGNAPSERLPRLEEFWRRVEHGELLSLITGGSGVGALFANFVTVAAGLPAFFKPNPWAFFNVHQQLGPEAAGYYSTAPLEATLAELVDPDRLNSGAPRLTVGAAKVSTAEMQYFDSRDSRLTLKHVLASGALPPAFPAVRIQGDLYWDGGVLSNTPVEAVFDDQPRRSSLVFAVHIWRPHGSEPSSMWEVMNRQKDLQYSSRAASQIKRQQQLHRLRRVIAEVVDRLPETTRQNAYVRNLASYGCVTKVHVVRLIAPPVEGEDHLKDIDFSRSGIRQRREAGREDMQHVLESMPWARQHDPLEGFVLHEVKRQGLMGGGEEA